MNSAEDYFEVFTAIKEEYDGLLPRTKELLNLCREGALIREGQARSHNSWCTCESGNVCPTHAKYHEELIPRLKKAEALKKQSDQLMEQMKSEPWYRSDVDQNTTSNHQDVKCPKCNGKGYTQTIFGINHSMKCNNCDGTGRDQTGGVCYMCHGTGYFTGQRSAVDLLFNGGGDTIECSYCHGKGFLS